MINKIIYNLSRKIILLASKPYHTLLKFYQFFFLQIAFSLLLAALSLSTVFLRANYFFISIGNPVIQFFFSLQITFSFQLATPSISTRIKLNYLSPSLLYISSFNLHYLKIIIFSFHY